MYYTTDKLCPVSSDILDEALSSLIAKANHHTEEAQLLRAIKVRSGCIGRTFNKSCIPAIQAALPGYSVRYYISDAVKRRPRMLVVIRLDDQGQTMTGPSNHWTLELSTADAPKLTAEHLDEQIAYHVEQARKYSTMAAELPAQVAAFNSAAAYLKPIKCSINTAMLYAGI